ncbi:MAG: long-chain fatty acid--CoA ligase [Bacteroidetes bacterium]|nr:long-chain fatty acid--CoA ligase [Bacteroidota bacterium]MBL6964846.1 long-chain fatty acid--CoA ligase [Bacteroidota bacterium]
MAKITRTFDVLTNAEENFNKEIALSVKRNGKWENFSTSEYRKNVDAFSLGLLAMGFNKGDKIATITNNRPEWNFIDFGMSQIGCVHVGIYPTISDKEYLHILSHSDSRILIVSSEELYNKLLPIFKKTLNLEEIYTIDEVAGAHNWREITDLGISKDEELRKTLISRRDDVKPDDLLTLLYTSGTTGLSKGVMLSHNNVVSNFMLAHQFVTYLKAGDRALSFLPLSHVLERVGNYLWQSLGLTLYYAESIETIGDNMREIKVNVFITVPRVFEKVYDKIINKGRELSSIKKALFFWAVRVGDSYDPNPVNRSAIYNAKLAIANKLIFSKWREALGGELKGVISGGAALQARLARIFWAAQIIVQEGYGLTETSPLISANNSSFPGVKFGSVGVVPKELDVMIAEDGEILEKGPNLMIGYYKDPEKTKEVIDKDGWFHTGDIGTLDEDRMLTITDRKKEIFKLSGGKYVAPQPVENQFKESQFIEQIIVVGENEKFAAAIIVPDFEFLHKWCSIHKVTFRDNDDLIIKQKLIDRYQVEVDKYNKELDHVAKIKVFRLVADQWTPDNGLLSPTQKLKRKVVIKKYSNLIGEIYKKG